MNAEQLVNWTNNNKDTYDSIVAAVKHLRSIIDRVAVDCAKQNADWHDDPQADDYNSFNAAPAVQFPRAVRDEAIRDLVAYYLAEIRS